MDGGAWYRASQRTGRSLGVQLGSSMNQFTAKSSWMLIEVASRGVEPPAINVEQTPRLALSMKLLVYSDLHNEFDPFSPPMVNADVVILAGDISTRVKGVEWANEAFNCLCLYVAGNHEFYGGHLDRTLEKMKAVAAPHTRVLENEVFVHGNVRFIGTTGWTDFTSSGDQLLAIGIVSDSMNDFRKIRTEDHRRIRPDDLVKRNHIARDWLEAQLSTPFGGKTVVITHHAPMVEVTGQRNDGHVMSAFANQWRGLVLQADVWVFGHTHKAVDAQVGSTRVVSNPRGYPNESTGFNAEFLVELGCV